MKEERILNILGQVDEKYIEEAAPAKQSIKKRGWPKWGAMAACIALVVCAGGLLLSDNVGEPRGGTITKPPAAAGKLPVLTSRFEGEGMGFEGLMFYDISESGSANPWTRDAQLDTLPVYRNLAYTDASGLAVYLSKSEMLTLAEKAAAALGTAIESTEYDTISLEQQPSDTVLMGGEAYSLAAETELGEIKVSGNGGVRVFFSEPVRLPEKYNFTRSGTSDEEAAAVTNYLLERFSSLVTLENPVVDSWGDYTFHGEQARQYGVYNGGGDLQQQILSYNFDTLSFSPDGDGALWSIRFGNSLACAEKLGDYPIITLETAQNLLLDGEYITTVPQEYLAGGVVRAENIAKSELIYRKSNTSEVFMPYYRFYIELTQFEVSEQAEGLKCFGVYYVPAVGGEYLSDFPVWDGSFN